MAFLHLSLVIGWLWRALATPWIASALSGVTFKAVIGSVPIEVLAGPAVLVLYESGVTLWKRTIHGQEWSRVRAVASRKKALERHWDGPSAWSQGGPPDAGQVRLGINAEDGQPFDISIDELGQHVFIPGASGTGKGPRINNLSSLDLGCGGDRGRTD